jgi:hypothetical protein
LQEGATLDVNLPVFIYKHNKYTTVMLVAHANIAHQRRAGQKIIGSDVIQRLTSVTDGEARYFTATLPSGLRPNLDMEMHLYVSFKTADNSSTADAQL